MALGKYEIHSFIDTNNHNLIIEIGNPNGDLKVRSENPRIEYHSWPVGETPNAEFHPVQVFIEEQRPAGNPKDLRFSTTMMEDGGNMRIAKIFSVEIIPQQGDKVRRKKRSTVPVTSGGGGPIGS